MSSIAILRGASPLCRWDVESGKATFHERANQHDRLLLIGELDKLTLAIYDPEEDRDYRVRIGDFSLADILPAQGDAEGFVLGDRILWREWPYFESARGRTTVTMESQPKDAAQEHWTTVISVDVYVLPTKLGEERYEAMGEELAEVSRSLLVDLYGKSRQTHDLRMAKEGSAVRSYHQELHAIESVLKLLGPLLQSIGVRPASRVVTNAVRTLYWGEAPLTPAALAWLSRRGVSPTRSNRPIPVMSSRKVESFDIPEHRIAKAFLDVLKRRAHYCLKVANDQIESIQREKQFRHVRLAEGPTIYERIDLPRIRRLESAVTRAGLSLKLAQSMGELPFLQGVPPEFATVHQETFQRNAEYRLLLNTIREFLLKNALWFEGDDQSDVTKLTSRLFEQWCYLRLVNSFRKGGIALREWNDALRQNVKAHFILDFDRGLTFQGELEAGLRLHFRYEPWILSKESASQKGESLCRGSSGDVAWCPDIVIECLKRSDEDWRPIYGLVLDCKYSSKVENRHWNDTAKYQEIRSTQTQRQIVRQLWLIAPAARGGIRSEDPAVDFSGDGPSCASDESVRFLLSVAPGEIDGTESFDRFAIGTIEYLKRNFGSATDTVLGID